MKPNHFLFLLLMLFLEISVFSQPFGQASEGYRIKFLDYENSSGEKGRTYFNYDNKNKLYRAFWTLKDGTRNSVNFYEYDAGGNLISAFRDFSDGLTSTEVFEYDKAGNKIAEFFYRSDSLSGKAVYHYSNGRLADAGLQNHKGWLNGNLNFYYNDEGKKSSANLISETDTICSIYYDYDQYGNMVSELWQFINGWEQLFRYTYEKEDKEYIFYSNPLFKCTADERINKEYYSFNGETGGPSLYHYGKSGRLEEKEFIRSDSISTLTHYEYDNRGRLKSSFRDYSDGRKARFSYDYDEFDNLILRNFFINDSLAGFEAYYYNAEGSLIKASLRNYDSWLTGTLFFDLQQNYRIPDPLKPRYARFQGENGFDADLSFQYDENELLEEIRWDFSFGKYQIYKLRYPKNDDTIIINKDIQLIQLKDSVFIHVSYHSSDEFGRFPSNGMLIVKNGKALMIDTPMDNAKTRVLIDYLSDSPGIKVNKFIAGHFHDDCIGGIATIQSDGIESFANIRTIEICRKSGLKVPDSSFTDSIILNHEGKKVVCFYPGPGHSEDNIVVWLPEDEILFGGCLVKAFRARNLGNLQDANVNEWDKTLINLIEQFPEMKLVVPGHGDAGGKELIYHTINLVKDYKRTSN